MEEKTVYIDSKGIEHDIENMPSIMVFYTVAKYGKAPLEEQGYKKLVERFENIVKNAGIINMIKDLEVNNDAKNASL